MYIRTRDESIEQLSETLKPEQLRKAITQNYNDTALYVMVSMRREFDIDLTDNGFSAEAINKLAAAYADNKISDGDLYLVAHFAPRDGRSGQYIDDFLDSIDNGVYHETAAKIFAATPYEKCSYKEAADLVKTVAFYPTNSASLAVSENVAKELNEMNYPLRACEGFNYYYDIDSSERLTGALERGAAIVVPDKTLAVKVNEAMRREDWSELRGYIVGVMDGNISDMSGNAFDELCKEYECEKLSEVLYDKVKAEYDKFISDMQKEPAGVVIESAYEIVWKDNITQYLENENPDLSPKQYAALISAGNALEQIYSDWVSNGELHSYDDIGTALEYTADAISYSREREQKEPPPVIPEIKAEDIPAPTAPKRKSR